MWSIPCRPYYPIFATPDFEAAVVGTFNQGEDADTTRALADMLAGALCGAQALPRRWLGRLERSARMAITEQTSALLALRVVGLVA